nr:hypothetical protein [uncultured Butyrivibrio sp.]
MKKIVKQLVGMILLMTVCFSLSCVTVKASSYNPDDKLYKYPYGFDFVGGTCYWINAGSSHSVQMFSQLKYNWTVSTHTSKGTYLQCKCVSGNDTLTVYVGADEAVGIIHFYLYPNEDPYKNADHYIDLEVHVLNMDPALSDPTVATLMQYPGNNLEFNAWYYYINYPDLRAACGINGDALLNHWNNNGKQEKRVATRYK